MLRRAIGAARHKARVLLTQRMAARLSVPMRDRLDALIAVDNDQPAKLRTLTEITLPRPRRAKQRKRGCAWVKLANLYRSLF